MAKDINLVLNTRSTRQRNSALNRASGKLHFFSVESVDCPTPERPQLEKIASQWLEIILASASTVGSLNVCETVASPYIVGAPVPAARLIGRYNILAQIEAAWTKPGQRDSLVIFGHRRMGKTSIARNVAHLCQLGDDTRLAFLNLQIVDWSEGLRDLCHAIAFALWQADPNGLAEPAPQDYEQHPLAALRRLLARLKQAAPPRRYILMVEESRFYLNGHVYFNGIWAQAGEAPPGQQTLLKLLAPHGDGLDQAILREQSGLDPAAFTDALDALERHDVVNCHNGRCRYSVELMRRWVADYSTLSHSMI
ncbi:MAG: hypothetical protein IPN66_15720 [Candidatus Competibacteraceae bacterium]|nr:hypothetical protein [Candidatus Competibacteraceae bacterium]